MKVESQVVADKVAAGSADARRVASAVMQPGARVSDRVTVAADFGALSRVRDERAARFESVADSVRSGSYRVEPERVARRVVDEAELSARLRALLH